MGLQPFLGLSSADSGLFSNPGGAGARPDRDLTPGTDEDRDLA
jgi:hypothetical protein